MVYMMCFHIIILSLKVNLWQLINCLVFLFIN